MNWLRRMFAWPKPAELAPVRSTRHELRAEKLYRNQERRRTERLAQILDDYRAQDQALRR